MIRLRDKNGKLIPVENLGFVEVCDLDGNVSCAVYPDLQGHVHIVTKNSAEHKRYENIFNVTFTKIVNLPKDLFNEHV